MSKFQRIKNIVLGILAILYAVSIVLLPEQGYPVVAGLIGLLLFLYGFRLLWYYFTMARHMVGGKASLYQGVIVLDLALFTSSMAAMNTFTIMFYLLGIFAFTGVIDILRANEAKKIGASSWKYKFFSGIIRVVFALAMLIISIFFSNTSILVYGFCLSLAYKGVELLVTAFRKTAIVYIQ